LVDPDPDEPFKKWSEFLQKTPIVRSTNNLCVRIRFDFEGSPSKLQVQLETLIGDFFDLSHSHIHEEQEQRLFLQINLDCDKLNRWDENHYDWEKYHRKDDFCDCYFCENHRQGDFCDCERAYHTMLEKILASQEKVYH
jgi:hypothetical protein